MSNLLVLGSRPNPNIPNHGDFDVACVNSSGYQAKQLGLKNSKFTIISFGFSGGVSKVANISRGKLYNLQTGDLIYLKHRLSFISKSWIYSWIKRYFFRYNQIYVRIILKKLKYSYKRFSILSRKQQYLLPVELLGKNIEEERKHFSQKYPSTGIYAVLWGIKMGYDKIIISGIGLDNTSGYFFQTNKYIRGHIEIDTLILNSLINKFPGRLFTTEIDLCNKVDISLIGEEAV